jgi:hypothetical protein
MIDSFLSGWGMSEGKKAIFVYECATREEAEAVKRYAKSRGDQKGIEIHDKMPVFDSNLFHVEHKDKENNPRWYRD